MFDNELNFLEVNNLPFNPDLCRNETEVESKLIVQYLLPQLGYTPDTWYQEVAVGSIRLDFLAFTAQVLPFVINANSPLSVVMEAKHPKQNLNNHVLRLKHYLISLNVQYGLLTNGKEIRIYQKLIDEIQLVFSGSGKEVNTKIEEIKILIGRESFPGETNLNNLKASVSFDKISNPFKEQKLIKIIVVYHNKGGVGKTTTVVNLAAAISKKGKRVLVM